MNGFKGCFVHIKYRPSQLVTRFELLGAVISPNSEGGDITKIVQDIKSIIMLVYLLQIMVHMVVTV